MGTVFSIDVLDDIDPAVLDDVVAWWHHVDATFSTYRVDSPVSRFGLGELELADLDREVLDVFDLCEAIHADSGGAFDIACVPAPNGSRFDPSGLVKGWSIERAVELLERVGARNLCINGGGDVAVRGEAAAGTPWAIGLRHPDHADRLAGVVHLSGRGAVATSGTYERGAHIIDPATEMPTTELASVTVVGPDLTYADAYATAVHVMGLAGLDWIAARTRYHASIITRDGEVFADAGWASVQGW